MENQVNTASIEKTPEQIEAEMFETRESLTEKVAALENQVVGTVQTAANTLTDTVDAVKSFVTSAPETVENVASAVGERVKRTFDISSHVQSNPWTSLGVSMGLGFLTGYFLFNERKLSSKGSEPSAAPTFIPQEPPRLASPPREPGLIDELLSLIGHKVKEMTENVIDSASVAVNKNIRENVPKLVEEATRRFIHENHENGQSFDAGKRIYGT
jgi:ElaB/YqjD/DUF883 family membrane-anchored ribosome-binding protein